MRCLTLISMGFGDDGYTIIPKGVRRVKWPDGEHKSTPVTAAAVGARPDLACTRAKWLGWRQAGID